MCYNPYKSETKIFVRNGEEYIPVSEESGLLKISNMRMQRWLESNSGKSYFDELRNALGENQIIIQFSGTAEDMFDLQMAISTYCKKYPFVDIKVQAYGNSENNSSKTKLKELTDIVNEGEKSDFKDLLPEETFNYLNECLYPTLPSVLFLPLTDISQRKEDLFGKGAYQMICLSFAYEDMHSRNNHKLLNLFSKELNNLDDRNFEKERFLFLCTYEQYSNLIYEETNKLLSEYGIWDVNTIAIKNQDLIKFKENYISGNWCNDSVELQKLVQVFNERYADQYRLRKMHDVLNMVMKEKGYDRSNSLIRNVDDALRGDIDEVEINHISDKTITRAADWITHFYDNIDHLIEID